jgi:hypothetical protein
MNLPRINPDALGMNQRPGFPSAEQLRLSMQQLASKQESLQAAAQSQEIAGLRQAVTQQAAAANTQQQRANELLQNAKLRLMGSTGPMPGMSTISGYQDPRALMAAIGMS